MLSEFLRLVSNTKLILMIHIFLDISDFTKWAHLWNQQRISIPVLLNLQNVKESLLYIRTCPNIWVILNVITLRAFNMKKKLCNIFYAIVSSFTSANWSFIPLLGLIAHWFWAINRIFISTNSMYQHIIYSSRLLLSNFIALTLK